MSLLPLLLALSLSPAAATRPAAIAAPHTSIASPLALQRLTLANGLEGLLLPDPGAPMVGVFAVVRAGLAFEAPGENGLSHFLEHLLFNGTTTLTQEQLYAAVDAMGGYSNATTRADHTVFQMLVPREHLGRALGLHAAMLFDSTLPESKFEKERGIVLEEIAKDQSDPSNAAEQEFRRFAWDGGPLARPVIGSPETLRSISIDAVRSYWRRRYVPANVTVLVVGDADRASFAESLSEAYASHPALPVPVAVVPAEPSPDRHTLKIVAADTPRLELRLRLAGPEASHPDVWALEVLARLRSQPSELSLSRALSEAGFSTAEASLWLERTARGTSLVGRVSALPSADPKALALATLAALARAPDLRESDLASLRTELAVEAAFLAEKPHYFGLEKASLLVNAGSGALAGEALALQAVEAEAIRAAQARWVAGRAARMLAAGPGLAAKEIALEATREASPSRSESSAATQSVRTLRNGIRLAVRSNPASSVFAVHVLVRDRSAREAWPGAADLVQHLIGRRGAGFEARLRRIGAKLKTVDDPAIPFDNYYDVPEYAYLRLETLDAYAEEATRLLAIALGPLEEATPSDLERAREEARAASERRLGSSASLASRRLASAIFGADSPLARSVSTDPARLASLDGPALAAVARQHLAPEALVVSVETGSAVERIAELVAGALEALPSASSAGLPRASPAAAPEASPEGGAKAASQAQLRMGAALRVAPADRAAASIAAAILGERLAADIRETRGMAYSIGASLELRDGVLPDSWVAAAGTRPENLEEVRSAMLAELRRLKSEPPAESEVRLAAARQEGRELMRRLTAIGRAYYVGLDLWRGEAPGAGLERVRSYRDVDAAGVRAAIEAYFDPERVAVASAP